MNSSATKKIPIFTEEEEQSDYYRFRNSKGTPKRIKFFAFCTFKPAIDVHEHYSKRKTEDEQRDVDFLYLKERLMDKFAVKPGSEEHIEIYQNRTESELWQVLAALEKDETPNLYDCFIFVFLTFISPESSENGDTKIHFYDEMVSLDKIWDEVSKITYMRGMPKMFLVQADDVRLMQEPQMMTKAVPFGVVQRKIPTDADRLTIICTIPGKHFVGKDEPSFLIRALVEVLDENTCSQNQLDLLSLTVLINQRVLALIANSRVEKTKKQADYLPLPCTISTLRKLLMI